MKGFTRAITLVWLLSASATSFAATLNVGPDSTYKTIQAAITAASTGDVINVSIGTYIENVALKAGITLIGAETARTFLKAASTASPVITASGVTNSRVSRFTFIDSTIGIQVSNASAVTIAANVFNLGANGTAVNVTDAADTSTLSNNTFYTNKLAVGRTGISTTIQNNIFVSNVTAISSTNNVATGVTFNQFFLNTADGQTGTSVLTTNPLFASLADRDFHLKVEPAAIDKGTGTDTDGTTADRGAYGGVFADLTPFPVKNVVIGDSTVAAPGFAVTVSWAENASYFTGSYNLHYYFEGKAGAVPYNGTEAASPGASPQNVGKVLSVPMSGTAPTDINTFVPPVLNSVTPQSRELKLSWNRVASATGYEVRYGISAVDENIAPVGNVSAYTLRGLQNGVTYLVAVVAVRQPILHVAITVQTAPNINISGYSAEATKPLGVATKSNTSNILTGIPEEVLPYPALPNEGCFIATAAYGSYSAAQVKTLRDFRDHYLLTNAPGRAFVAWYYTHSPSAARYLNQHPALKPVVRGLLLPFVFITGGMNDLAAGMQVTVIALTAGLMVFGFYRRRHTSWA